MDAQIFERLARQAPLNAGGNHNIDDADIIASAATRVQVALERLLDDTPRARRGIFR